MGLAASCSIIAFADDIVLLAENETDLQRCEPCEMPRSH